ncbi:MAG TPA: MmgE/PrpD family protein [Dermatophilaceae bacterium]|nr:MmgE/PrpD family protein [Dermatophilaceae bacterium]
MSLGRQERPSITNGLAEWAVGMEPAAEDLALADRALLDTVAVGLAARAEPILAIAAVLSEESQWAVACHIIDFDDLHLGSTTHISTVCVPVAISLGGGARSYLAGAAVMARVGTLLGWQHYAAGWHATATAGAIGAAAGAAVALGLDVDGVGRAMALAVPAAGGVQRSFGTDGKSLQIGFAAHAGVRAARLAAAGASADLYAVDDWIALLGGSADQADLPIQTFIPGGLAIKLYPCCYALQRPIGAATALRAQGVDLSSIQRIVIRTPRVTVKPLIHSRPRTGLEAKFSLEYSVVAALLDEHIGFATFSDEQVRRPEANRLIELVEVDLTGGGDHLLSGEVEVEVHTAGGIQRAALAYPPGSPQNPPTDEDLRLKIADCLTGLPVQPDDITWASAAGLMRTHLTRAPG